MTDTSADVSAAPAVAASNQEEEEQVLAVPFYEIKVTTPNQVTIELPAISALEIPFSIKSMLLGYQESCAYTCYQLVLRGTDGVATPLQDFVDLGTAFADLESNSIELFMEPTDYTIHDAKSHVSFIASIISAPPKLKGRKDGNEEDEDAELQLVGSGNAPVTQDVKHIIAHALSAPKLNDFHKEALFKFAAPGLLDEAEPKVSSSFRGIAFSGWNPPPPQRKAQGDLFYIEVDSGDGVFQVTAIASGFFVNRSTKSRFDPRPAEQACFSHELLVTILGHSASIRNYWRNEMNVDTKESEIDFITRQFAFGQGDRVFAEQQLQWNAYRDENRSGDAELDGKHVYSMSRAVEYFSSSGIAGSSVVPGAQLKEWHDELELARRSPVVDVSSLIIRGKAMQRIVNEFKETATNAAIALLEGSLLPLNPGDPKESLMVIYNNLFLSYVVDSNSSFKLSTSNEACRKMYVQDIHNQRYVNSLEIEGLSSILSCMVEYKGQSVIVQSIIPGVLQTSSSTGGARLVYGSSEEGSRLKVKTDALEVMKKVGTAFGIAEREIWSHPISPTGTVPEKVEGEAPPSVLVLDNEGESAALEARVVSHIGPVEAKIIEGTDKRMYLMELTRLTPLDANFVESSRGGTGNILDAELETMDKSLFVTYTVRRELIENYVESKFNVAKQNALIKVINDKVMKASADPSVEVEISSSLESMAINPDTPAAETESAAPAPEGATVTEKVPVNTEYKLTEELIADTIKSVKRSDLGITVNPNAFIDLKSNAAGEASGDELAKVDAHKKEDEEVARNLATFLFTTVLPLVTDDIRSQTTIIHDGEALVSYLHRNGVNIRYLGRLAALAREQEKMDIDFAAQDQIRLHPMPKYWLELLEIEMIARSVKSIFRENMHSNVATFNSPAGFLADVLNFLLSSSQGVSNVAEEKASSAVTHSHGANAGKKKAAKKAGKKAAAPADNEGDFGAFAAPGNLPELQSSAPFSREEFWAQLLKKTVALYGASLTLCSSDEGVSNLSPRICKVTLLRRLCQQVGVQVASTDYDFDSSEPFGANDIYRFIPRVKTSTGDVISVHVKDLLVSAASFVEAGNYAAASSIYQQITILVQQVEGSQSKILCPVNDGFAKCLIQMGHIAPAISVYEKNLALAIQTSGLDSVQTLQQHLYLANLYISVEWNNSAIRHLQTVAYLVGVLGGFNHPEIITSIILLARAYAGNKDFESAISCLLVAKNRLEAAGEQVKASLILQDIAELYAAAEQFPEAASFQKQAYMIIRQMFGETDSRTVEAKQRCEAILRSTHAKAIDMAKQRQLDDKTTRTKDRQKWLEDDDEDNEESRKSGAKSSKKSSGKKVAPKKK